MKRVSKVFLSGVLTLLLTSSAVWAGGKLVRRFSDNDLVRILKDDGYSAVKKVKDNVIRIKIDGRSYLLLNKSDGDLQTFYAISGANVSYADINRWNRTKRLSRAYLDSDKDPVLESDLLANAGMTEKHVTEFFRVFVSSVKVFHRFIEEHSE